MIVPDVNLLVYAYNEDAPRHAAARSWWERVLSGDELVGLPWAVLHGYIRLMTHARILAEPLSAEEAVADVESWLAQSVSTILEPGRRHLPLLRQFLVAAGRGGSMTTDAVIAAITVEYQATLFSNDLDFGRFPGLRWENPLENAGGPG